MTLLLGGWRRRGRLRWVATGLAAVAAAVLTATTAPAATIHAPAGQPTAAHRYGRKPAYPHRSVAVHAVSSRTLVLQTSNPMGAVGTDPHVYLVFWGSAWNTSAGDPRHVKPAMVDLFDALFGTQDNWSTILSQYCEGLAAGTTHCGSAGSHITHLDDDSPYSNDGESFEDTASQPGPQPGAGDLDYEAIRAAQYVGADADQASSNSAVYLIFTPHGVNPDGLVPGYCGEHSNAYTPAGVTIAWAVIPYVPDEGTHACTSISNPGPLDGIESAVTAEYADTLTDLQAGTGWLTGSYSEIADECTNDRHITLTSLGTIPLTQGVTATYDVAGLWSNNRNKCVTQGN